MQINRLFEIVYILLDKKNITAKELATKFEVSTRTIYRDIEILSAANVPIYASKGKGGGISLLDSYVLDKSLLSEEEQCQILSALKSIENLSNEKEKILLRKMNTIFKKDIKNWINIDFSDWGDTEKQTKKFELLKESVINKKRITFIYYNSSGEKTKRKVEPLQIYFKNRAWYLKAYCLEKQEYRLFKISRIKEIKILKEIFNREIIEEEYKNENIKTVSLSLKISNNMSYRVYDEFPQESIAKDEDGNFIINAKYQENDWLYGYLLSFGENIRIIKPEHVNKIIKEKLKKSLKNYL